MGKIWLIASGKGGVGKTTLSAALSRALGMMQKKVCVIDTDTGLRDLDAVLGLENDVVYDLLDVCSGKCRLSQALLSPADAPLVSLLPAAQFARARDLDTKDFRKLLSQLKEVYDFILIDCPAGSDRGLRRVMCDEIDEELLVCTPDDVCIRDAEQIAALFREKKLPRPQLVVNKIDPELVRAGEMYSAATTAEALDLNLIGEIPDEKLVTRALVMHRNIMDIDCECRNSIIRISRRMQGESVDLPGYGTEKVGFFSKIFRKRIKEVRFIDNK